MDGPKVYSTCLLQDGWSKGVFYLFASGWMVQRYILPVCYRMDGPRIYSTCLLQDGWSKGISATFLSLPHRYADWRCIYRIGSSSFPSQSIIIRFINHIFINQSYINQSYINRSYSNRSYINHYI